MACKQQNAMLEVVREQARQKVVDLARALEANAAFEQQLSMQGELITSYDEEVKRLKAEAYDRKNLLLNSLLTMFDLLWDMVR